MPLPDRVARLNTNGTPDPGFTPPAGLNDAGLSCAIMADGVIAIGGRFLQAGGAARNRLVFFNPDGSLRPENIVSNWDVSAMARQADGRIVVAGRFTTAGGVTFNRLFRLTESRTVEPAFNPDVNGSVYAVAVAEDGKIYVGGGFTGVGDRERLRLARLLNDDASQTLAIVSSAKVRWLRGGSSPATSRVTFEVDTGSGYGALGGITTAIAGGWEVTGLALSGTGTIRARVYPSDSHSAGLIEETLAYDIVSNMAAIINGTSIADGGSFAAGDVRVGQSADFTVILKNTGLAIINLTGPSPVTKSGTHAAQFTIVNQPALTIEPGENVSFTLRFTPSSEGAKAAALSIATDMAGALAIFNVSLSGDGTAGTGSIDASWMPVVNGNVMTVTCSDDVTFIGGDFTTVNGVNRARFARLNSSAAVQAQSGAGATGGHVLCAVELLDGKWLIGGTFTAVNGVARAKIARLNADGTLDTSWSLNATGYSPVTEVSALAVQADGKVIIGGCFAALGGQARNHVARLNANGTLDMAFNPNASWFVQALALAENGKIYLGGGFATMGGLASPWIARLNADGTLDSAFSHGITETCYSLLSFPGGGVIYSTVSAIGRLESSGTPAIGWANITRHALYLAQQADGKILAVGGDGVPVRRYSSTAGTQDATWADTSALSRCLSLQPDGKVIIGGTSSVRRIINDDATGSLAVVSATELKLLRGGAAPEAQWVRFELSEDGGTTWSLLGTGTRITGGWSLTGTSLPQAGKIRARAYCGRGIQDFIVAFSGLLVPDIQVEFDSASQPEGSTLNFSGRQVGQSSTRTVKLRNTGAATLNGLVVTITGAEWDVTSLDLTSLTPLAEATLIVRFSPSAIGASSGLLSIASNVPGAKNPYVIVMTGNGVSMPTATTTSATLVTNIAARLRGTVKANHDTAKAFVEWKRKTDSVWTRSAPLIDVAGFAAAAIQVDVTGLTPATAYHYRTGIYNDVSTSAAPVFGANVDFTTTP